MNRADLHRALWRGLGRLGIDAGFAPQVAIWLLLVALVIQVRLPDPVSPNLPLDMGVLTLAGVLAAGLLVVSRRSGARPIEVPITARVLPPWTTVGAIAGIICAIAGERLADSDVWDAQWWWLVAMATPLLTLIAERLLYTRAVGLPRLHIDWRIVFEACALFLVALVVRSIDITGSPPFVLGDEASCGLAGRLFNAGHTPLLAIGFSDLPMLTYAIPGLGMRLFGDNEVGMRMAHALIGSLGVLFTYQLGKEWFSRRAGLIAGAILAFSLLHVELSRDGLQSIQGPTAITLTLLLCTLWLERGGPSRALLTGLMLTIDLQVYWAARIIYLLLPAMVLLVLITERSRILSKWHELAWMVVGLITGGLPLLGLFHANPGSFDARQSQVNMFSNDPALKDHLFSQYGNVSKLSILIQQSWKAATAFNARGDASVIWGPWGRPILDVVSGALFPASLALALLRALRWQYATCLLWIVGVVGASAVTIDPPLWPRFVACMPAVALLIGALLAEIWQRFDTRRSLRVVAGAGIVVVLTAIAVLNLKAVYHDYPSVSQQVSTEQTSLGNFLAHAAGANQTVLLSDGSTFIDYETVRFLAPNAGGCSLLPGEPLMSCPYFATSKLFVLLPGRLQDLALLQSQRPGGRVVTVAIYGNGQYRILAYELT